MADAGEAAGVSPGVHIAPFGSGAVVYDTITETAHLVDALTRAILRPDDPELPLSRFRSEWRSASNQAAAPGSEILPGDGPDEFEQIVARRRAELTPLGLMGRAEPAPVIEPVSLPGPVPQSGDAVGATHVIFDIRYAFTGPDRELIDTLDEFMGVTVPEPAQTLFRVIPDADDPIDLHADTHWRFPSRERLLTQLPTALNRIAARSDHHPVLHAGGVVTPAGEVLLVTGPPRAGKSTLIAHLVRLGCDHLGDESIAVLPDRSVLPNPKPLTLRSDVTELVGVDDTATGHHRPGVLRADARSITRAVGPVTAIVETRYDADVSAEPLIERLEVDHAVRCVLANTLNLGRAGEEGLRILADLAWKTPVVRVTHGSSELLAETLLTSPW